MATRLINNLSDGGPSSCVISVGSWVVHTGVSILHLFVTVFLNSTRCQLINKIFVLY